MIEFVDVSKRFDSLTVLDRLNLTVEQGLITTIIGRSGVGKTILLKHIAGLVAPDEGRILYRDENLLTMSRREKRSFRKQFSFMFQNMALFDSMTVFENVALPLEEGTKLSRAAIHKKVMDKIEQLELENVTEKYPSQLSGGMRKRVAFARALISEPELILFDEPDTGLDPIRKQAVYDMIGKYKTEFGFTGIIVSHEIPDVFDISEKVALLEEGRIYFEGTQEEIESCSEPVVRNFIEGIPYADKMD